MSRDRIIRFNSLDGRKPTKQQLWLVLEDFLGDTGDVSWEEDRFFINLTSKSSNALGRVTATTLFVPTDRWIEVWLNLEPKGGVPSVDIITRQQDEFTNALADGVAALIGRYWEGTWT